MREPEEPAGPFPTLGPGPQTCCSWLCLRLLEGTAPGGPSARLRLVPSTPNRTHHQRVAQPTSAHGWAGAGQLVLRACPLKSLTHAPQPLTHTSCSGPKVAPPPPHGNHRAPLKGILMPPQICQRPPLLIMQSPHPGPPGGPAVAWETRDSHGSKRRLAGARRPEEHAATALLT